jgi:sugar (pentulose or hexulose) kinase
MCTLVKYRWMRDHWPDTARGVRWLNVAEWIVQGLGGEPAAELSLASRTGFYDLHERRQWADALAWADAPDGLAPDAVPAGTPMGATSDGAVLAVGGHDHLAAAVGAGAAGGTPSGRAGCSPARSAVEAASAATSATNGAETDRAGLGMGRALDTDCRGDSAEGVAG